MYKQASPSIYPKLHLLLHSPNISLPSLRSYQCWSYSFSVNKQSLGYQKFQSESARPVFGQTGESFDSPLTAHSEFCTQGPSFSSHLTETRILNIAPICEASINTIRVTITEVNSQSLLLGTKKRQGPFLLLPTFPQRRRIALILRLPRQTKFLS